MPKHPKLGNSLDDLDEVEHELVRFLDFGVAGQRADLERHARRLARRLDATRPALAQRLRSTLQRSSANDGPFRSATMPESPVDTDTRLPLLRIEHPIMLEVSPVWDGVVHAALQQLVDERRRQSDLYTRGITPSRSALFHGPPGVGKTLAARWVASQLNLPLLTLDLASVVSSFLGRTGSNIRNVLEYAKGFECVLFLDELDAIAKRRDDAVELGELKRLVTVLLQEIDEWPDTGLLLSATNHADLLDPAVWRRFDLVLEFHMASADGVRRFLQDRLSDSNVARSALEALTVLFEKTSFSDIDRDIRALQRRSVLAGVPLIQFVLPFIRDRVTQLPRKQRHDVAYRLYSQDFGQREVHDLTGVSRDTLRKLRETSLTGDVAGG